MFNLDPGKLLVIAVVAIILLGPDRLPQVARQVGGAWRSFNEFRHRMESEVRSSMPDLPPTSEIARLARSPSALLNHLSTMSPDGEDDEADEEPDGSFQPQPPVSTNGSGAGDGPAPHSDAVATEADANGSAAVHSETSTNGTADNAESRGTPDHPAEPHHQDVTGGARNGSQSPAAPAPTVPRRVPSTPTTPSAPEVISPGDPTLN